MHVGRMSMAAALVLALSLGTTGAAQAAPAATPDWEVTRTASGVELVWRAPGRVPTGGAQVQFYAGERYLGAPRAAADQRSFRLTVPQAAAADLSGLQVRAAGRRLDGTPADDPGRARRAAPSTAALLPANPVDPGVPGPYATISGEYTLADVALPGYAAAVEMKGLVVAPQGTSGSRPLVLLLHGRHDTCYRGTTDLSTVWPCASGWTPVPSYRGYQRIQQVLASQGYVTVSISANGVNAQDNGGQALPPADGGAQARSSLIRRHLQNWAAWAGSGRSGAPAIVQSAPVTDMSKVLLVGHSRGGEGVNRAAVDSLTPPPAGRDGYYGTVRWQIRGTALIGPTAMSQNPAPDVPSVILLPGCDGDVADLQGQMYADATRGAGRGLALHGSVFVAGANHNYFNAEWTPGLSEAKSFDDVVSPYDPQCRAGSSARLTPQVQQQAGATYVAAAAATFVAGDDQVRPLLDGSGVRAPSADPATVLSSALGGNRTALIVPAASTVVTGTGAKLCEQVAVTETASTSCDNAASPNFTPFTPVRPEAGRYAVRLDWSSPGTAVRIRPAAQVSLASAQSVAARVVVPAGTSGTSLEVAVVDSSNRRATLGTVALDGMPGTSQTEVAWSQEIRVPMSPASAAGLDLTRITALEIVPRSTAGTVHLVDAWGWRPGTPAPQPYALPRVDLGELTVTEGNSGTTTYQVPATVTGTGSGQIRVSVVDPVTGLADNRVVTVASGSTSIAVPVAVTGNTQHGDGRTYVVAAKALSGVTAGDVYGSLTVQDDD